MFSLLYVITKLNLSAQLVSYSSQSLQNLSEYLCNLVSTDMFQIIVELNAFNILE